MSRAKNLRLRSIKETTERKKLFGGTGFITMPHTDTNRFDCVVYKNYMKSNYNVTPLSNDVELRTSYVDKEVKDEIITAREQHIPMEVTSEIRKPEEKPVVAEQHKPPKSDGESRFDVDFSFLAKEPEIAEEDKEFLDALDKLASASELLSEFKAAICVPAVADFTLKSYKHKLTEYPDTTENADNPERKAFVNILNILKRIIRKED